ATASEVSVRPWGMPVEAHAAGVRQDTEFVEIELPPVSDPQREYHDVRMTVAVGPSRQRWLIEEALERGPRWHYIEKSLAASRSVPPRTHADTASSLLGCLYAADYVRGQKSLTPGADVQLLEERISGLVAQLLATQGEDGGWSWCGARPFSDPWTSAQIAWALGKARQAGYPIATQATTNLVNYLRKNFADANPAQYELKAVVLHGLSWLDEVDFAHVNRLHRSRQVLSTAALGHLALTLVRLDRKAAAMEILSVLEKQMRQTSSGPRPAYCLQNTGNSAWMNSELEISALALLAQLSVDPRADSVPKLVNYLTGTARADGWRPHKARGTVLAALATYYTHGAQQAANYTLDVSVNGGPPRQLKSSDSGSLCIELSGAELQPGKQRIDFTFAGRGEYAYAVTLRAFSRGFPDPDSMPRDVLRAVDRRVWPPKLEYNGRVINAGFSVTVRHKWFRNEARHLNVGQVAAVDVRLRRYERSDNAAGDRDYVVVKETIPPGFRLLPDSVRGEFLSYDYADNVLTVYYGTQRDLGSLRYQMVATTPGVYRLPPAVIRSLYHPSLVHVNLPGELVVLPRDAENPDEYRMTPDELYHIGRRNFDDGHYDAARKYLEELLAGEWLLNDEPYRESVRMLLTVALERDEPEAIVNYFEILKEKYPDLVVPFEQIIMVAQAYSRTGQHERAYLIYRATADASFIRDASVGGMLQEENRFLASIDFLEDLWRIYPDTPQVESTNYALSQTLYARANSPETVRPRRTADTNGRQYVTRDEIIREVIQLLEQFLALYPTSPVGDEASYSLANALLDLNEYETVIARAAEFGARYPDSRWLDRFRYIQALALFHLGEFERASQLALQVSEATYRDEQGVERPSPNKWLALYIVGQIYHAQSRTADALEYYKKVRERFSDAAEAINLFEQRFVELPEVTIFHPDDAGFREAEEWTARLKQSSNAAGTPDCPSYPAPFVRIDYRNISSAVLQVYRVDLLKLALIEKNLAEITAVNLAGIKPIMEQTIKLGDGHDYVDKSFRVELAVESGMSVDESGRPAPGAYLVICRGDELFSSGLVLVTPLAIEVREDLPAHRARISVVDAITRRGLSDVHMKVIGTRMQRFVAGDSDLRGVFVAEDVQGYPTAVARDAAGHFAFHRSPGAVLAMLERDEPADEKPQEEQELSREKKTDYRFNLSSDNTQIQLGNEAKLKEMFKQQQKGVKVKSSQ
ncbi:MAG: outer membrane protein assembly factor BamD, partial [Planctomycetota bacterium]